MIYSFVCFTAEEKKEEKMDTTPPGDEKKGTKPRTPCSSVSTLEVYSRFLIPCC